jgi:ubiquinone/menaquinone biosynthesis C-methylase UbiE
MPEVYDSGRSYSPHALKRWLATISAGVRDKNVNSILDLGCGTGRFSSALADRFDAFVWAIDPSQRMLQQASRKPHPRVRYVRSSAEQLPFKDGSIDLVFMSMVFHHFDDQVKVARECRRVVPVGGSVCLRAGSLEQVPSYPQVRFFERSAALLEDILQPSDVIVDTFRKARLYCVQHRLVQSESAKSWEQFAEKVAFRADSVLSQLTDHEFKSGLAKLRRFAKTQSPQRPVVETIDFFVFRRQD